MATQLKGAQTATVRIIPKGRADPDAADLAVQLGMPLEPWQCEILTEASRMVGNKWSAYEVTGIVPRQNGKSFLFVARMLAGALLYGERLILYSAHEYRTAQETWRLLRDMCESEQLKPHVKQIRTVAGGETVEFYNGARIKLIARTRTSGRGFSPDCILLDEAFAVSPDIMAALQPSMAARPNPQIWYMSSAGTWESSVLLDLRKRGHTLMSPRFAYWEWHALETDDHTDPKVWAATNPAYGVRLTRDAVERELGAMTKRAFMRERCGVWTESLAEVVLPEQDVADALIDVPTAPRDGRPVGWGVDASWDRTGAAIAAAFRDDSGRLVATLVETHAGAGWLPDHLGDLAARTNVEAVAYDARGGITDLMERAERDYSVPLMPLRHAEYPAACADLAQRVADHSIRFGRAPLLVSDLTGATAKTVAGGWVWSRQSATPPTHLIAVTAAVAALERSAGSRVAIY